MDTTLVDQPAVLRGGWESTLVRGSAGAGLHVDASNAVVRECEVRESAREGIDNWGGVPVHDRNLVQNAGVGIDNPQPATADVEDNWWGDAAGPTGTTGDGVSGPLDYTPWRISAFVLPCVP